MLERVQEESAKKEREIRKGEREKRRRERHTRKSEREKISRHCNGGERRAIYRYTDM